MTAAQELFDLLKDARPAVPHHSKPVAKKQAPMQVRAIRFHVQLPELGGAVELCPKQHREGKAVHPWFDPTHCVRCGAEREQKQYGNAWAVLPCACKLVVAE